MSDLLKTISPLVRAIVRLAGVVFGVFLLLAIIFGIIRVTNKTAQMRICASDINEISQLRAAGISACFVDNYEISASTIFITGEVVVETIDDCVLVRDEDGTWLEVNSIILRPVGQDLCQIWTPDLYTIPRVDYEIFASSSLEPQTQNINFDSSLFYITKSFDDFTYSIEAPRMEIDMYWRMQDQWNEDCINLILNDYTVYFLDESGSETKVPSEIQIPVKTYFDENFGEYWNCSPIVITGRNKNSLIKYKLEPDFSSQNIEEDSTILHVYYPEEIDAVISGDVTFRYGITSKDIPMHQERIYCKIDKDQIYSDIDSSKGTSGPYLMWDDKGFYFHESERHHPNLILHVENDIPNKRRRTSMELNTRVMLAELNKNDMFPNLSVFLRENWLETVVLTGVITAISYLIKRKEE